MLDLDRQKPYSKFETLLITAVLVGALLLWYFVFYVFGAFWFMGRKLTQMERRKAVVVVVMIVAAVFLFSLSIIVGRIGEVLKGQNINYDEIMAAPFNLAKRPVAASGGTYGLLPPNVGDFSQNLMTKAETTLLGTLNISNDMSIASLYALPTGEMVEVQAVDVGSHNQAVGALRKLQDYADLYGRLGNFAFGLGEVSYIYYRIEDVYAMAWAHGPWVYIVSGASFADVNRFVENFPY